MPKRLQAKNRKPKAKTAKTPERPSARRKTEKVASPWNNGFDKVERVVDTINAMKARRQIDDNQYNAADRYRTAYQACHGSVKSALDTSSHTSSPAGPRIAPPPHMLRYAESLREAKQQLGSPNYLIVAYICGEGASVNDTARLMYGAGPNGKAKQDDIKHVGRLLRESLITLSVFWFGGDRRRVHGAYVDSLAKLQAIVTRGEIEPARAAHAGFDRRGVFGVKGGGKK
jgi:hypothetical protein